MLLYVLPATQDRHTQFDEFDGGAIGSLPARHKDTGMQTDCPDAGWYELNPSQTAHGVAGFESVSADPGGQGTQAPYVPAGVYVPTEQFTHGVRGLLSMSVMPAAHGVQTRSLVRVEAISNCPAMHGGERY